MAEHFLGIDVGYSKTRRSTGLCLLTIDGDTARWELLNTGTDETVRLDDLRRLVPQGTRIEGVGIDGPLTSGLRVVNHYRTSDALLSRGCFRFRGKPGQTNVPTGQQLHQHATKLANLVLKVQSDQHFSISGSTHPDKVDPYRLLEVFPNAFLAVLLDDAEFPVLKRDASDRFWEIAVDQGYLDRLLGLIAPGVTPALAWGDVRDHDHRAALVCALAAMAVARGRYVAVGDPVDGDIFLPPLKAWGRWAGPGAWAEVELCRNVEPVRQNKGGHPNHEKARLLRNGQVWH